eukprot:153105-Amphidinium_carterae.1
MPSPLCACSLASMSSQVRPTDRCCVATSAIEVDQVHALSSSLVASWVIMSFAPPALEERRCPASRWGAP